MIETGCYKELNVFGPNKTRSPDLVLDLMPEPEKTGCFPFSKRVSNTKCTLLKFLLIFCHIWIIKPYWLIFSNSLHLEFIYLGDLRDFFSV